MSDTGLQDTEGSEKRWLPGHSTQSPGDKCKNRGIRDRCRPISGESEAGAQARNEGRDQRENAVEGRLRTAVATLGPLSGYFILANLQQWEGVWCGLAGQSAKERVGFLESLVPVDSSRSRSCR